MFLAEKFNPPIHGFWYYKHVDIISSLPFHSCLIKPDINNNMLISISLTLGRVEMVEIAVWHPPDVDRLCARLSPQHQNYFSCQDINSHGIDQILPKFSGIIPVFYSLNLHYKQVWLWNSKSIFRIQKKVMCTYAKHEGYLLKVFCWSEISHNSMTTNISTILFGQLCSRWRPWSPFTNWLY